MDMQLKAECGSLSEKLLLECSKYIQIPILTEWLDMPELCRLDSALCNNFLRKSYLELICSDGAICHGLYKSKYLFNKMNMPIYWMYMVWITKRKLVVHYFFIPAYDAEEKHKPMIKELNFKMAFLKKVTKLDFHKALKQFGCARPPELSNIVLRNFSALNFPKLEQLSLYDLEHAKTNNTTQKLKLDFSALKTLKIELSTLYAYELAAVTENCTQLREVSFNNLLINLNGTDLSKNTYAEYQKIVDPTINAMFLNNPELHTINLRALATSSNIHAIANYCANLTNLCIDYCEVPSVAALQTLLQNCSKLCLLSAINLQILEGEKGFVHSFIPAVCAHGQNLTSLDVSNSQDSLTDYSLVLVLLEKCSKLRDFYSETITYHTCAHNGSNDESFAQNTETIAHLNTLETITFTCADTLTDAVLKSLADKSPQLSNIEIVNGELLTNDSIAYLVTKCKNIHTLRLSTNLELLSTDILVSIADNCLKLKALKVTDLSNMDDTLTKIEELITKCVHLESLEFEIATEHTDLIPDWIAKFPQIVEHELIGDTWNETFQCVLTFSKKSENSV